MKRYKISHQTIYGFSQKVTLLPHTLRLRPREGHELHIESSVLDISPSPVTLRWHRDAEENSVATANFDTPTDRLTINSEIIIQQYDQQPLDFLVADYAVNYPFEYDAEDLSVLRPYIKPTVDDNHTALADWIEKLWQPSEKIQTYSLLERLNLAVNQYVQYRLREEEGVQSAAQTLEYGFGSCRDSAQLFIEASRQLGFAARFVSGYLCTSNSAVEPGSTHAWAEVFLPGAGWKGFDPTSGDIVGAKHIAVAVAKSPEAIPPVSGAFHGPEGSTLTVGVWVIEL